MSDSRFSLFAALPCDLQEKIYTYLPDESLANRVNRASNQARIRAIFSDQSANSLSLQKKLLNCWMHSKSCPVSAYYLEKYVINRETFYATPLHYQLLVLALYNKLKGEGSQLLTINGYVEDLLATKDILDNSKAVNFFIETSALLSQASRQKLVYACLERLSTTANINLLFGELSFYLTEDAILKILLNNNLLAKLEYVHSSPIRCAFSDNIMRLVSRLSDVSKVKVLRFYWDYFFQSNKTPESIFYLTPSIISSISDTTVMNGARYQNLLGRMIGEIDKVLNQKVREMKIEFEAFSLLRAIFAASNRGEVKEVIASFFESATAKKNLELFPDSAYEVLWDNAVEAGNFKKATDLIHYFLRLTPLKWNKLVEMGVVEWLIGCFPAKGHHFINNTLNKIIIKIVDKSNLDKLIDLFLRMCESSSKQDMLHDSFWRVFRSFLRHPFVSARQRNDLLVLMISEINRGAHSIYFLLPVNRLRIDERGILFDSVLTKYIEESSVSLIDALSALSGMSLPHHLIGSFINRLIEFLLHKAENDLPVSLENIYDTIINLSKQSLDADVAEQLFVLLKNPLFGNKKFILLKFLFDSNHLPKHWDDIFGFLTKFICQTPLVLCDRDLKIFERCVCIISRKNPNVLLELLNFLIEHVEVGMFVRFSLLKCITGQSLARDSLLKCIYLANLDFPLDDLPLARVRLDVLKNLAKYSCLPQESMYLFFMEAKGLILSSFEDDYISGFDLAGCILHQVYLPQDIQEDISCFIFEALYAECSEKILCALRALKVWHEVGYSSCMNIKNADQERLLALTDNTEEQIQSEAIYLINVLPHLKLKQPKFVNMESIFLMAIQEERGVMCLPSNSRAPGI